MDSIGNPYPACYDPAGMADESEEKAETLKKSCTLAALTLRRLERLARRATHGATASAIMANFIEAGIRESIEKGYIRMEDDE